MSGIKLGVGMGLVLIAISEMTGAESGLGYMIWNSWQILSVETMYVGLILIAILGAAMTLAWKAGCCRGSIEHLRTMTQLAEMGAIIAPPVPAFYSKPADIDAMIDHTVGRVLDLFDLDAGTLKRRGEEPRRSGRAQDSVVA